jgi:deoxyribose-phosphate aldolase
MCPLPTTTRRPLASYIDHTLLKPDALAEDVRRVVEEAAEHRFAAVCIPPCYVLDAAEILGHDSPVAIATVISFPFGYSTPQARLDASRRALEEGARELDTVINISRLKSGEDGWVLDDLSGWVEALRAGREETICLKVILETALLSDDEKRRAAQLVVDSGADYVKTSTGFAGGGATVADVELLAEVVDGRAKIKASGGIRDRETAWAMVEAGADRLGTSSGVALVAESDGS